MSTANTVPDGRFYRNSDKALLGGVCAGIADYLGFNLRVTRVLAFITFLMAMPLAVIAYFAIVFLVPSVSSNSDGERRVFCRRRKNKQQEQGGSAGLRDADSVAAEINTRCHDMDVRLARLEERVTSQRFQLEQELRNL